MSSILTNASAMTALRVLQDTNNNLQTTQNRIATGLKVSSAKDNASFWAVSTTMKSDVNSFKAISDNLSLAENSLSVARVGAEKITDLIDTIKTKTTQAQEGSISKEKLQADIDEALKQIEEITSAANFNGVKLLEEDTDVRLLSSIGRSGSGVDASYINFTSQNLGFGAGGGLESIKGLSVLDRGDSVVDNARDGVSVHDMGAIDTRRVRLTFDDISFSSTAADNDFNLTYTDTAGAAQTIALDNFASDSDMNDVVTALVSSGSAAVDSASWDEENGLTINLKQGMEFTGFASDGVGVAVNNVTTYTADKGNELTFTYTDGDGVSRQLKHTLTQDITADAEGAAKLVEELNANSKFNAHFNIAYNTDTASYKISNVDRESDVTLSGWSGAPFTKESEVVRFDVGRNGTDEDLGENITLSTTSGDNDFRLTFLDADGVEKNVTFADAASDWADTSANGFVAKFNAAMTGSATASYSAEAGLTIEFKNGASYKDIENTTAAGNVVSSTPEARETTTAQSTELNFQDAPLRLGEEIALNFDVNGINKEVVFKVTGNDTATGTRIDDETNPNRIVLALDARELTHESTTGAKIAEEIKAALGGMTAAQKTSFGIAEGATGVKNTSIGYQVDGAKLTLNSAGGFDDIKTATLPSTDYQALLDNLESALQTATDAASTLGSAQGRIDIQKDFLGALSDSLKVGIGTLVDANMNEESARLQALQVQQQLGIQSLSIANQAPQALLSLFR